MSENQEQDYVTPCPRCRSVEVDYKARLGCFSIFFIIFILLLGLIEKFLLLLIPVIYIIAHFRKSYKCKTCKHKWRY